MTETAKVEETVLNKNPIITPADQMRWPLLEMESQPCTIPISVSDEDAILLMDKMLEAFDDTAAGLAAVQIGIPKRIFLLRNGRDQDGKVFNKAYINPTVISKSKEMTMKREGCLSLPGMPVRLKRPKSITIQYMDLNGAVLTESFHGFWCQAVCHEMDHLDGRLIVRDLENQILKQPKRTAFGMVLDPHRKKVIEKRRAKKKFAKRQRK